MKERCSEIELLRIFSMILLLLHILLCKDTSDVILLFIMGGVVFLIGFIMDML